MVTDRSTQGDGLVIREACTDEAEIIFRVMKESFAEYRGVLEPPSGVERESLEDVAKAFANGGAILAFVGDIPVGTARFEFREPNFYVGRLGVLVPYRHRGIGRKIMLYLEEVAKRHGYKTMELITRSVMTENIELYRKLGYNREWEIMHPKAGRATIMEKDLSQEE